MMETAETDAAIIRRLERERRELKTDIWAEKTEHRMTKDTLDAVTAERNQLRSALAKIAEDCSAWCNTATFVSGWATTPDGYGTGFELIKRLCTYAHEQSQAPLAPAPSS